MMRFELTTVRLRIEVYFFTYQGFQALFFKVYPNLYPRPLDKTLILGAFG
jgi:hypothetical protein